MEIRPFALADAEAVAALHVKSWRSVYRGILADDYLDGPIVSERHAFWRALLAQPGADHVGLLAVDDGAAVGFAFALADHDPVWGTLLENLHVDPDRRGGGIGTTLLAALAERLALRSRAGLHLWAFEANARTRRYYERLGAAAIERQEAPAPDGRMVAEWRYAWRRLEDLRAAAASLRRGE